MISLSVIGYHVAGTMYSRVAGAADGTLHFAPACEPLAKQLFRTPKNQDVTTISFAQFNYAKVWLDMCTACEADHGQGCWTLFGRLHPEAVKN